MFTQETPLHWFTSYVFENSRKDTNFKDWLVCLKFKFLREKWNSNADKMKVKVAPEHDITIIQRKYSDRGKKKQRKWNKKEGRRV